MNNKKLNTKLKRYNIKLFVTLHHKFIKKKNIIKTNNIIKNVKQDDILECLIKSSLIISDFSSVIFDMIYQNKPFIIFIPDSEDININKLYSQRYFDIINSLKNNSIYFKNKFFNVNDAVNKIIYYINNNFEIEKELKQFYETFLFKKKNHNIYKLINYMKLIK